MYNKTIITEFGFRMISWIVKTSCLCYLPQPSASEDNTDLGFDNSWYHAQPHPIIVYYMELINPLTPVPALTGHAKTHPQFPVLAVTGREKPCQDNCLSYPPWRDFGPPIVLLLLRTNKPMRMDFLSIFLGDFRGPRKTVFCLQITRSKSAGNHGALRAKSTNFQSLVFIP